MAQTFDGTNDYLTAGAFAGLDFPNDDWFVGAWVKPGSNASAPHRLLHFPMTSSNWLRYFLDDGEISASVRADGTNTIAATDSGYVASSNWELHIVGRSGANLKVNVDGTEEASTDGTGNWAAMTNAATNAIGADGSGSEKWAGDFAELFCGNVYPTADQITALTLGWDPRLVFGQNLTYMLTMIDAVQNEYGYNPTWTENGALVDADHLAIIRPATLFVPTQLRVLPVQPSVRVANFSKIDPSVIKGSLSLSPGVCNSELRAIDPTVMLSPVEVTPTVQTANFIRLNPTVELSSLSLTPAAKTGNFTKVDPTVLGGTTIVAPAPCSANFQQFNPSVDLGSLSATPSPVTANFSCLLGSVIPPAGVSGGGWYMLKRRRRG